MVLYFAGIVGCLACGLSVILGAFAAHALKGQLDFNQLNAFETAVRYQMYHGFALLGVFLYSFHVNQNGWLKLASIAFIVGILLFSGSLYALVLSGFKQLGMITPLGGLSMIIGWGFFIVALVRSHG
ncbi:MAG: DUF423 domain-containing protein [bacterium]|nr:DUF423 domain-containing protein [bacterium]